MINASREVSDPILLCNSVQLPPPASEKQAAQVNGLPAQYAQGEWRFDPVTGQFTEWDKTISAAFLVWQSDGVSYCIQGSFHIPTAWESIIEIAESMK